jgi:hypothetical protein
MVRTGGLVPVYSFTTPSGAPGVMRTNLSTPIAPDGRSPTRSGWV